MNFRNEIEILGGLLKVAERICWDWEWGKVFRAEKDSRKDRGLLGVWMSSGYIYRGCLFFLLRVDHQTSFKIVCFGRLSGKGWLVDRWLAGGSGFANDDTLISIIYLLAAPIQHLLIST